MPEVGQRYLAPINIQQTAGTAADAAVWALWNDGSSKTGRIEMVEGVVYMAGSVSAVLGGVGYYLSRITTAKPTGGTALPITEVLSPGPAPSISGQYKDTGLTLGSMVTSGSFYDLIMPATAAGYCRDFKIDLRDYPMDIPPGEGIGIFLAHTAIALMGIRGTLRFTEN